MTLSQSFVSKFFKLPLDRQNYKVSLKKALYIFKVSQTLPLKENQFFTSLMTKEFFQYVVPNPSNMSLKFVSLVSQKENKSKKVTHL